MIGISLNIWSALGRGGGKPFPAPRGMRWQRVTHNGEPVTHNGEPVYKLEAS